MRSPFPRLHAAIGLWTLGTLAACAGAEAAAPPAVTSTTSANLGAPDAPDRLTIYQHRNHGGVLRLIAVTLKELDLSKEQRRKVEYLHTELLDALSPARDVGRNLAAVLADGVAAGAVDHPKAELLTAQLAEATTVQHRAMADGLNRLHALLTPEQRTALVAKMHALWARWEEDWKGAVPEPPTNDMAVLAEKLGLSPEQRSRIDARFTASMQGVAAEYFPSDVTARARSFGDAFVADGFDAAAAEPNRPEPPRNFGAVRMSRFFEAFAPELTAEQRAKLAQAIRDHASRHDQP